MSNPDRTFLVITYDGNDLGRERLLLTDDGRPIEQQVSDAINPPDIDDTEVKEINAIIELPNAYEGYVYVAEEERNMCEDRYATKTLTEQINDNLRALCVSVENLTGAIRNETAPVRPHFQPTTEGKVRAIQTILGVKVDGIIGYDTMAAFMRLYR